jgi:hypothetical protein
MNMSLYTMQPVAETPLDKNERLYTTGCKVQTNLTSVRPQSAVNKVLLLRLPILKCDAIIYEKSRLFFKIFLLSVPPYTVHASCCRFSLVLNVHKEI